MPLKVAAGLVMLVWQKRSGFAKRRFLTTKKAWNCICPSVVQQLLGVYIRMEFFPELALKGQMEETFHRTAGTECNRMESVT